MTQNKTVKTDASVDEFIASIAHPTRRQDAAVLVDLFSKVTGYAPKMWGDSIVGFGQYHYRYATGREGDFFCNGVFTAQIQFVDLHHARLWGLFRHFEKPWQTQIGKVLFIRKQIGRY